MTGSPDVFENYGVIQKLTRLALNGDHAAVEQLVAGLIQDHNRDSANSTTLSLKVVAALQSIGAPAMQQLARLLNGRPGERYAAFCAFETDELKPLAVHIAEDLFRIVRDRTRSDRCRAACVLARSGAPIPDTLIPILATQLLSDENRGVRARAVEAIGAAAKAWHAQSGQVPAVAVDALARALSDSEEFVRRFAIAAIIRLGVPDPALHAPLVAGFEHEVSLQDDYARALETLGFELEGVIQYALGLVRMSAGEARAEALRTLLRLDKTDVLVQAAELLVKKLDHAPNAQDISHFELIRPHALAALERAAGGANPFLADRALAALVEMRAVAALPLLIDRAQTGPATSRANAVRTLDRLLTLDTSAADLVGPVVVGRLGDVDADVRLAAVESLPALRSVAARAAEPLRILLRDEDARARWACCVTLCALESQPAEALPVLEEALGGTVEDRFKAVELLGRYRSLDALRLLLKAISDDTPRHPPIDTSDWWTGPIDNAPAMTLGQSAEAALSAMGASVLSTLRELAAGLDGEMARARALAAIRRMQRDA